MVSLCISYVLNDAMIEITHRKMNPRLSNYDLPQRKQCPYVISILTRNKAQQSNFLVHIKSAVRAHLSVDFFP